MTSDPAHAEKPAEPRLEEVVCTLCGELPADRLLTTCDLVWHKPGTFHLARCRRCNLVMTTPRPVPADMHIYYDDWYQYTTLQKARDDQYRSLGNRFIARNRLRLLERLGRLEPGAKLLDVGAGFGVQLDFYIRKRGIEATSLDFDPKTREVSIVRDVARMHVGDLLDADFASQSFDVVTFYESLEHVYDPVRTLKEAHRILKPAGRLAIDVPDFSAAWRRVFGRYWFGMLVPAHLHHFTKESLSRVVQASGFEPHVHRSMYWPYEATASLLIAYSTLARCHVTEAARLDIILRRARRHLPFFGLLAGWALIADFPVQGLLRLLNRTGTQGMIAVKRA